MSHVIAIFLKQSECDQGETRLAEGIGDAALEKRLAAITLRHLPWKTARIWICYAPDASEADVRQRLAPEIPAGADVEFIPPADGDRSARLSAVVSMAFAREDTETLTLLGTDCPEARWPFFIATHKMAAEGIDAVFGPAENGGFYLVILRGPHLALFKDMPRSSPDALRATMSAAEEAGLRVTMLRNALRKIETPDDLRAWQAEKRERFNEMNAGPIRLAPLCMERVWGGRELERLYGRELPDPDKPYGESWDVVDRMAEQSVVPEGPLEGWTLRGLWLEWREEIFGDVADSERFPLLLKILDARDKLSVQVHPPAAIAPSLGGEPKTEMWYIAHADPGAELYVGLKRGVTRENFAQAIKDGTVADVTHAIPVRAGDFIFIPSGRLHAIGAGLIIFEIQQNSDTTYRVFDWNRMGTDGKPRTLHVEESMACIDFTDFEPSCGVPQGELLVECPYFRVEKIALTAGEGRQIGESGRFAILSVVSGEVQIGESESARAGDSMLIPAVCESGARRMTAAAEAECLITSIPEETHH